MAYLAGWQQRRVGAAWRLPRAARALLLASSLGVFACQPAGTDAGSTAATLSVTSAAANATSVAANATSGTSSPVAAPSGGGAVGASSAGVSAPAATGAAVPEPTTAAQLTVAAPTRPKPVSQVVSPTPTPSAAPSPAVTQPASALISSAAVAGEGYRTYLQMPSPVVVGREVAVIVHLEPQAPFKSNDKYPYRFTVGTVQGAVAPSTPVTGPAVSPTRTTLRFPLTANRVGRGSVSGTFSFSVCTEEKCLVERAPLVLSFEAVADAVSASSNR